jgi:hypothetical protein
MMLHGDVHFCKMFAAVALAKDIHDPGQQWVLFAFDELVELSEVGDPTNSSILFWNNEFWCDPF